jgi:hypothetical protein
MADAKKDLIEGLKNDWKRLWLERFDDHQKAEGVAVADYSSLFVDSGTVIHATRDFKALNFKEILEAHKIDNPERFIQPSPDVGGWNKFIKTEITQKTPIRNKRAAVYRTEKKDKKHPKKSGRGWLHI